MSRQCPEPGGKLFYEIFNHIIPKGKITQKNYNLNID